MARLLKGMAYTDKKGRALMEVDVDNCKPQLSTDQFKTIQGNVYLFFISITGVACSILLA